jgi:tight adherence protein B
VLAQVAACWLVGAGGAGLVDAIQHVAASARAAEDVRVEMEAQLAGPRSTARLLSILPVVGLGLGIMLGADPVSWLVGSMPGRICLALGIALTLIGTWWTGRIAVGVERRL